MKHDLCFERKSSNTIAKYWIKKVSSWMYEKQLQGFICSLIYL